MEIRRKSDFGGKINDKNGNVGLGVEGFNDDANNKIYKQVRESVRLRTFVNYCSHKIAYRLGELAYRFWVNAYSPWSFADSFLSRVYSLRSRV